MPNNKFSARQSARGPEPEAERAVILHADSQTAADLSGRWRRVRGFFGGTVVVDTSIQEQFSQAWILLAALLTVIGLLWGFDSLLLIAITLLTIVAVSWLWNRLAFVGLVYRRKFSLRRAFVGETVALQIEVANRKFLPLSWLRVLDVFPTNLPIAQTEVVKQYDTNLGELSTFWALKWYERASRVYDIYAERRGFYRFGPATLETGDIFGLFHSTQKLHDEHVLIVYPKILPLTSLGLPAKEPFGDLRAPVFMFADPTRTVGVRDYHPEDDFRRLHWKATARRQHLQTRVLEPSHTHNLVVFLNVATLAQHWQGVLPDVLEQLVSIAASVCYYGVEQRWPTGLIANGALPRSDQPIKVPPGRAPGQITLILEMLAAVTPFATASIDALLAVESPRLPWGSTLVVISAVLTEALAATLLDLRRMGRRVVLISLDPAPLPETLSPIIVYKTPRAEMQQIDLGPPLGWDPALTDPSQRQQQAIHQAGETLRRG